MHPFGCCTVDSMRLPGVLWLYVTVAAWMCVYDAPLRLGRAKGLCGRLCQPRGMCCAKSAVWLCCA